jgi:hypothetical protein
MQKSTTLFFVSLAVLCSVACALPQFPIDSPGVLIACIILGALALLYLTTPDKYAKVQVHPSPYGAMRNDELWNAQSVGKLVDCAEGGENTISHLQTKIIVIIFFCPICGVAGRFFFDFNKLICLSFFLHRINYVFFFFCLLLLCVVCFVFGVGGFFWGAQRFLAALVYLLPSRILHTNNSLLTKFFPPFRQVAPLSMRSLNELSNNLVLSLPLVHANSFDATLRNKAGKSLKS